MIIYLNHRFIVYYITNILFLFYIHQCSTHSRLLY